MQGRLTEWEIDEGLDDFLDGDYSPESLARAGRALDMLISLHSVFAEKKDEEEPE